MESKKLEILNRLAKDGYITLDEALILLETKKEYVYIPNNNNPWQSPPIPHLPDINPPYTNPCTPNAPDWTYRPNLVIYGSSSTNDFFPSCCTGISCSSSNCICKK